MEVDQPSLDVDDIANALGTLTLKQPDNSRATDAISILAEASRYDVQTRQQLANPNVLRELIEVVECSINDALETVELALRCIGNACIDNDSAKEQITSYGFAWAKLCLPTVGTGDRDYSSVQMAPDVKIATMAAKVLYNVCSDYEPAQQRCFNDQIHPALVILCTFDGVTKSEDGPLLVELLFWICSHIVPDQGKLHPLTLGMLLSLPQLYAGRLEHEDLALLFECNLLFLREDSIKYEVVRRKLVNNVWQNLKLNEERLARVELSEDDRRLLRPLSTGLIWILSDLAAMPEFALNYSLQDELLRDVLFIIQAAEQPYTPSERLVDAACQIVGNLLWQSQENIDHSVVDSLQQPLWRIMKGSEDVELLHSAAGLFVQLLRLFPELREIIGSSRDTQAVIERLCRHEMPQLKQDGIAILKT